MIAGGAPVKTRPLRIIRLSTPPVVRARVKPVAVSKFIRIQTIDLPIVRIIARAVRDSFVVCRHLVTLVPAIMTMAVAIAVPVTPTIAVSVSVAVAMAVVMAITPRISSSVPTPSCGIAAGIHASRSDAIRIRSTRATWNNNLTRFSFNHAVATIAAAIAQHSSACAAPIFISAAVVVVAAIIVIASRRPAVIVPTAAAVRCRISAWRFSWRT
jgi:hypothetical protein